MFVKIKMAGIYSILHNPTGKIYIGMSVDIYGRWQSHYNQIRIGNHSSILLMELWTQTDPSEWSFSILEYVSISDYKIVSKMKGKALVNGFRTLLLKKEKEWMKKHSINFALNKNNKQFQ
jgi:hypothetical protein